MMKRVADRPITGRRLWLFRIIAITVIPALLFLLLEIGLRIVGYGFPTTATIKPPPPAPLPLSKPSHAIVDPAAGVSATLTPQNQVNRRP